MENACTLLGKTYELARLRKIREYTPALGVGTSGFRSLDQLCAVGMDMEEFLPQILCRLATAALMTEDECVCQDVRYASSEYL